MGDGVTGCSAYRGETSHWPAEFMVPVEVILALGVASILANLIINIRQPVGNDGKFRAQHLLFIVFFSAALTLIWQVHDIDLHDQFGPFSAQWNPQLYQLTIGACTLITAFNGTPTAPFPGVVPTTTVPWVLASTAVRKFP